MPPRSYQMKKRADTAAATRRRIVHAAHRLFRAGGLHRAGLAEVARAAGVGRTTVFEQFGSRRGLLLAVEDEVSRRAGVDELLAALSVEDGERALEVAFLQGSKVWAAERPMFRRLYGGRFTDPELEAVLRDKDARRRALCRDLCVRLSRQGRLRRGTSVRAASDLLALLTSFETFEQLVSGGLSVAHAARTLLSLSRSRLLADSAGRGTRRRAR
jgi:AcrR family transcriptional regulator